MENSYLTRSIKQSGWKYFEKLLSEQGRFSVFRVVKKLQNRLSDPVLLIDSTEWFKNYTSKHKNGER